MAKRTSVMDIQEIDHLNDLDSIVKDKRVNKRTISKKGRRNRHYIKVLIKHQLKSL